MKFIIEKNSDLENEANFLKSIIEQKNNKKQHSFIEVDGKEYLTQNYDMSDEIPVGTIPFVEEFLWSGFLKQNPIEIPKYLQTDKLLKRKYWFSKKENFPKSGIFFLKNVSTIKSFAEIVDFEKIDKSKFDSNDIFLISEVVNIISEYRVYVIDGKIENIANYNGNVTVFPDMSVINEAVWKINLKEKFLKSYTIDVMITDKGTSLIEIHNFVSVGLYSTLWGDNLLWAYKQGIDYLVNDNQNCKYL